MSFQPFENRLIEDYEKAQNHGLRIKDAAFMRASLTFLLLEAESARQALDAHDDRGSARNHKRGGRATVRVQPVSVKAAYAALV